jgi:hypothetical protein
MNNLKYLSTREKIVEIKRLRTEAFRSLLELESFINELGMFASKQTYSLGSLDRDSLEALNDLKIKFANEEIPCST